MKLRNKKTGEIIESACIGVFKHKSSGDCERVDTEARSLEKVLEEWEDAEYINVPNIPLIKDEKIRKAVRAWAEANGIDKSQYHDVEFDRSEHRLKWIRTVIEFDSIEGLENLDDGRKYTITELCGEEEECES